MRIRPIALALVAILAAHAATSAAACTQPPNAAAIRSEVVQRVNAERSRAGLASLRVSNTLTQVAQGHACDNARRNQMSHTGGDGSDLRARLRRGGYGFRVANENIGLGFGDAGRAVSWWMNSPGHRANFLEGRTRDAGVGVAVGPGNRLHWVVVTGLAR